MSPPNSERLKAGNVTAWAEASLTSAGPGQPSPKILPALYGRHLKTSQSLANILVHDVSAPKKARERGEFRPASIDSDLFTTSYSRRANKSAKWKFRESFCKISQG